MPKKIVTEKDTAYPVKPSDINAGVHLFEAFNNDEKERSAGWIVRMCQEKGGWFPFTYKDISTFYHAPGRRPVTEEFWLNGLDKEGFLVLKDDKYYITHEFIANCFRWSPAYTPSIQP